MKYRSRKLGFSLLELLVALMVFGVVSMMGVSAVLVIIASNRTSQAMSSALSNFNLALEAMSRNIRVGMYYHCGAYVVPSAPGGQATSTADCSSGQNQMSFLSENGSDWYTYTLTSNSIHKWVNGVDQGQITAPEVNISTLMFYVNGAVNSTSLPPSKTQPRALIIIMGSVTSGKNVIPFNIQTTVSQRLIP